MIVWQKGIDLTVLVYALCETLPATERYGLVSQMQRSAVSVYPSESTFQFLEPPFPARTSRNLMTIPSGMLMKFQKLLARKSSALKTKKQFLMGIPSNIAEGYRRNNRKEYYQFCGIALGSAAELETQLIITSKIYSKADTVQSINLCVEVQKMLTSLIAKLKA